jgi:antitoxin YefM
MQTITVEQFRNHLPEHVDRVLNDHEPLKVTAGSGGEVVVLAADDWTREQETLAVLQDPTLVEQIARSAATRAAGTGYRPSAEQLDEIDRL